LEHLALNIAYLEPITEQFLVIRELHISLRGFKSRGLWKVFCRCCLQHRWGIMLPGSLLNLKSFWLAITHPVTSQPKIKT